MARLGISCSMAAAMRTDASAAVQALQLREVLLQTTHEYIEPDSTGVARFWHVFCENNACESYSVGDGFCLMQALIEGTTGQEGHVALVNSNCRVSSLNPGLSKSRSDPSRRNSDTEKEASTVKVQLLHCPRDVPLAILTVPKCGTTSVINWVLHMDTEEYASLLKAASLAAHHGPGKLMNTWLIPELERVIALGGRMIRNDELFNRLLYRVLHRLGPRDQQSFVPPAHLCPTCCMYGDGRQLVVVARNPYVRLTSYYRFTNLNDDSMRPRRWTTWLDFGPWLKYVLNMRASKLEGFANNLGWVENPSTNCTIRHLEEQIGSSDGRAYANHAIDGVSMQVCFIASPASGIDSADVMHLRPLSDMVKDERFMAGSFVSPFSVFEAGAIFALHLETLADDVDRLESLLCHHFGHCKSLPPFPKVLPAWNQLTARELRERCLFNERTLEWQNCTAPRWTELWTADLISLVVATYIDDFRWLGYSKDPKQLLPLPPDN